MTDKTTAATPEPEQSMPKYMVLEQYPTDRGIAEMLAGIANELSELNGNMKRVADRLKTIGR